MSNRVLYVPENFDDIDDEFLKDYLLDLIRKGVSKGWSIQDLCIFHEKMIHRSEMFDTRFVWRDCMSKHGIKWKSVPKDGKGEGSR